MATRIRGATLINTLAILREVLGATRFQAIVAGCPARTLIRYVEEQAARGDGASRRAKA